MASDNAKHKLAGKKAEEAMRSFMMQEIKKLKLENLQLEAKLHESKDEANNLEIAYKKAIHAKAELNDKVEQLTDDLNKYSELYHSTKVIAQALGEAVYFLTKEKQHG
jgi:DNA repair exonuclease SbcCD ATPase subunit